MKTVLVADDEFDLSGTLQCILEEEGYRAEVCSNGKEALERIRSVKPDLVLMDVMMPILSGFEVVQAMRQCSDLAGIPVILMSSVPPGVKRERYGWQTFLRKPFTIEALMKHVEEIIGKAGPRPG